MQSKCAAYIRRWDQKQPLLRAAFAAIRRLFAHTQHTTCLRDFSPLPLKDSHHSAFCNSTSRGKKGAILLDFFQQTPVEMIACPAVCTAPAVKEAPRFVCFDTLTNLGIWSCKWLSCPPSCGHASQGCFLTHVNVCLSPLWYSSSSLPPSLLHCFSTTLYRHLEDQIYE